MIYGLHESIRASFVFAMVTVGCLVFGEAVAGAASQGWLAFGDLRGAFEPCGCDPSTDLGGIKRIITAVGRERILKPNVGVFSLGNSLGPTEENPIKNKFLLTGLSLVKPDATLFNILELSSRHWLEQIYAQNSPLINAQKFVLSNLKKRSRRSWISSMVVTEDYLVFGYLFDTKLVNDVEPFGQALLLGWRKAVAAGDAGKKKVLLFSGSIADLELVKKSGFFDVIISSHTAPLGEPPSQKDKDDQSRLARMGSGNGEVVWMVPLAGQGYLRGGDLQNREGPSLDQVFSQPEKVAEAVYDSRNLKLGRSFSQPKIVTWLLPEIGDNQIAQHLYDEYMQETKRAFALAAAARVKDLSISPFAGWEACSNCHATEVEAFRRTKHFHAMDTLVSKGKDQDPECVVCHSVGAKITGGFVSLKDSPSLAGVQCENCHGPRKEHTRNPLASVKNKADPFEVCLECHNSQHSPRFDQREYWRMIEHGRRDGSKTREKSGP